MECLNERVLEGFVGFEQSGFGRVQESRDLLWSRCSEEVVSSNDQVSWLNLPRRKENTCNMTIAKESQSLILARRGGCLVL